MEVAINTDNAIHVAAEDSWFKSSYSNSSGGSCVEIAITPRTVKIRDSKNPEFPGLTMSANAWAAFTPTITS